jgi:hypothetical protein
MIKCEKAPVAQGDVLFVIAAAASALREKKGGAK